LGELVSGASVDRRDVLLELSRGGRGALVIQPCADARVRHASQRKSDDVLGVDLLAGKGVKKRQWKVLVEEHLHDA
jgi:hypothetical protein